MLWQTSMAGEEVLGARVRGTLLLPSMLRALRVRVPLAQWLLLLVSQQPLRALRVQGVLERLLPALRLALFPRALREQAQSVRSQLQEQTMSLFRALRVQEKLEQLRLRLAQVLPQQAYQPRVAQENQTSGVLLTSHRHLTGLRLTIHKHLTGLRLMTLKPRIGQT